MENISVNVGTKVVHKKTGERLTVVKTGMMWRDYPQVRCADRHGFESNYLLKNLQRGW